MSRSLTFAVPGEPVAKGRPRVVTIAGSARGITPAKTRRYEAIVQEAATLARQQAGGDWPLPGAVELEVVAVFRRPGRLFRRADSDWRVVHDRRPDLDNVLKAVADGMDGAGIWQDDARVVRVVAEKWYGVVVDRSAKTSEPPHVIVTVRCVENA